MRELTGTPDAEIVLVEAPDGGVRVDVRLDGETDWLTRARMKFLYGRERSVVSRRLSAVFREGELDSRKGDLR